MKDNPLEKDIERAGTDYARERGVLHLKFTSPQRAAVMDRILLAEIPEFLRPIIAQYVRFVEYKRAGQKPTPVQLREHERFRRMGFTVDVVDNKTDAKRVIGEMGAQT